MSENLKRLSRYFTAMKFRGIPDKMIHGIVQVAQDIEGDRISRLIGEMIEIYRKRSDSEKQIDILTALKSVLDDKSYKTNPQPLEVPKLTWWDSVWGIAKDWGWEHESVDS